MFARSPARSSTVSGRSVEDRAMSIPNRERLRSYSHRPRAVGRVQMDDNRLRPCPAIRGGRLQELLTHPEGVLMPSRNDPSNAVADPPPHDGALGERIHRFLVPNRIQPPINPALLKHAEQRAEARQNRLADAITAFSGSMLF